MSTPPTQSTTTRLPCSPLGKSDVAVIVPTRNSAATLRQCLESIKAQQHPCTLVVVDNGSMDETPQISRELADLVLLDIGPERSAQRNAGAAATAASIVGFIDSDMVLPPELVAEAVAAIQDGAASVIVPERTIGEGFWADVRAYERTFYRGSDAIEAPRFFPRAVFDRVGGFDEALTGPEDWDLGLRTAGAGRRIRITATILHHEGRVRYLDACRKKAYYAPGLARFFRKHGALSLAQASRRPWLAQPRALAQPLGIGLLVLKTGEVSAVAIALAGDRLRRQSALAEISLKGTRSGVGDRARSTHTAGRSGGAPRGTATAANVWVVSHGLLPNGPAERLTERLRLAGIRTSLSIMPFPGMERMLRVEELQFPTGALTGTRDQNSSRVPISAALANLIRWRTAALRIRALGWNQIILIGCDPLAYLQARLALAFVPGLIATGRVMWFVDFSAQRMTHRLSALAYRSAIRLACRDAHRASAISPAAAASIAALIRPVTRVSVLANAPLTLLPIPVQVARGNRVVYLGGLRAEHGAETVLPALIGRLADLPGVYVDIVGDGPAARAVRRAADACPRVTYYGLVDDREVLTRLLLSARVGLAIYDPDFPMFQFNDPLKERDYLAAGLRVVSTLPRGVEDPRVQRVAYSATAIVQAIARALSEAHQNGDPEQSGSLAEDTAGLADLIDWLKANGVATA